MPMVLAASTIRVPAGTVSLWPAIVRWMSGMGHRVPTCGEVGAGRRRRGRNLAFVPQRVVLVLLAEVPEGEADDPARGVAQAAEAAPILQTVGDPQQRVDLDLRTLVGEDPLVRAYGPVAADAAGRALAARLVGIEL